MTLSDTSSPATAGTLFKVALACIAVIAGFVLVDVAFFAGEESFKREGGGLETISALLYFVAIAVFFALAPARVWLPLFQVPALMALFAMREFDMDKAFTHHGIMSLKQYTRDNPPLTEKLISGAVALFALYVLYRVVRYGGPAAWRALQQRELWPWFGVLAGVLVVGAKSVDGLGRKMLDFGIVISDDLDLVAGTAEEIAEAFIPVCAILAIVSRWKGRSQ